MSNRDTELISVAGNGLLDRRIFLTAGIAGGVAMLTAGSAEAARPPWSQMPGEGMGPAGAPSKHEAHIKRIGIGSQPNTTGAGSSRTPLEHLDGIITPSRLHFERHHSGIPDIDPDRHRLLIHGLVERPLAFTLDALERYPMTSHIRFIECAGNSASALAPTLPKGTCGEIHGLLSASEWTGVPLAVLLEEAGVKPEAKWLVAEGADAAMMSRSVPLAKALDDAVIALYQNGERLRPSNGYPMRLLLPGWEGNMNVKWLHRIKLTTGPAMTKDETSRYSDLQADGKALLFTFPMGVKSVITSPSPGLVLRQPGVYQVKGIAWSGAGRIRQVEISADGGKSWAQAALDEHVLPKCLTRFRAAWRWNGGPAVLMSRATDETGSVQPTRDVVLRGRANGAFYHNNAIQAWRIVEEGGVENVRV